MKRFRLILLSLALVMALCASAFAVDVKFSGSYYAAGMYLDKTTLNKNTDLTGAAPGPSTAFYYQRLRLQTDFMVSPGLKLVTRANIMERSWGAARSAPGTSPDMESSATRAENENIGFDWAYVEYISPIGMFDVGIQDDGPWGTVFGDNSIPQGMISWFAGSEEKGGVFFQIVKMREQSRNVPNVAAGLGTAADNDMDKFQGGGVYKWKNGEAGLLAIYFRERSNRVSLGATGNIYCLQPYTIVKIGPAKIQAEIQYAWGEFKADDPSAPPPVLGQELKIDNLAGWVDATVDLKQFYFGGTFAYVAGQDWTSLNNTGNLDKVKGGFLTGGMEWNPTLILFNNERQYWAGSINGHSGTGTYANVVSQTFGLNDTGMYNAWFLQGRAGFRPIDKLDILASVSYAKADSKTLAGMADAMSDDYGTEVDITATYKITNNLSYMIGAGYLFTGNYFKGTSDTIINPNPAVNDDYMLINKLTLTF